MKKTLFVVYMIILSALFVACQTSPSATVQVTEGSLATSEPDEAVNQSIIPSPTSGPETMAKPSPVVGEAYPPPSDTYPPPLGDIPAYNPYPGPSDGVVEYLDWDQVEALILKGEVSEVYQAHSLHVTLVLPDKRVVNAFEPQIDEVFRLLDRCGDPCKDVIRATE